MDCYRPSCTNVNETKTETRAGPVMHGFDSLILHAQTGPARPEKLKSMRSAERGLAKGGVRSPV
jgi:hypothetical protein